MNDERYLSSGEPYGYLLSGKEEEEHVPYEESEAIEGEFREVPSGEEVGQSERESSLPKFGSGRGAKAQRQAEKEIQRVKRAQLRAKRAQAEDVTRAFEKAEWERKFGKYKDIRGEVTKTAGQISKALAPAGAPGGAARFYLGRPGRGLYVPGAPSAEGLREIPAKRALQPHTERLRRTTAPGAGTVMPIAGAALPSERLAQTPSYGLLRQPLQYGFLREAGRLKGGGSLGALAASQLSGTSRLEQAVFAEVRSNNDVDTLEHIKSELAKLGYSKTQVEVAVRSLERKGFIEKQRALPGDAAEYVTR